MMPVRFLSVGLAAGPDQATALLQLGVNIHLTLDMT